MSDPRPTLHQPPNPDDLRRAPPAGPACAQVRGLLRDFADGDLGAIERTLVEEHVHVCFACSVELSRAEHEVLRLRRGFAGFAANGPMAARLPADFAQRVVDRIVDDSAFLSRGELASGGEPSGGSDRPANQAPASAGHEGAADAVRVAPRSRGDDDTVRRFGHPPLFLLAAAALVLVCFGALAMWSLGFDQGPEASARLIVLEAKGAFGHDGRLTIGDGVGESQWLQVGAGGSALFGWHDLSSGTQPAATIEMNGRGSLRLHRGAPLLVDGRVAVQTNRPVEIPVADGSTVQLGIGEYVIAADLSVPSDDYSDPNADPLLTAPGDLRIEIEVLRGQPARILGTEVGPTLVAAGSVGVFGTGSMGVVVRPSGTQVASVASNRQPGATAPTGPATPTLAATVYQRNGLQSVGTKVLAAFSTAEAVSTGIGFTNAYGSLVLTSEAPCDRDFAILHALPGQAEFGTIAPDAFPLQRDGVRAWTEHSLVLDVAAPLHGSVVGTNGQPRLGVRVLPCIVDELFGSVFALSSLADALNPDLIFTDELGHFTVTRLPATLPSYQHLALVLVHPELETAVVPVPVRGGANALLPMAPIVMRGERTVQLIGLPHHVPVTIWEEIPSLTKGTAIVAHQFETDWLGRVQAATVGFGELRYVDAGVAYRMIDQGNNSYFKTVGQPVAQQFRPMENLSGTDLFLASTSRHQRFDLPPANPGANAFTMVVRDSLDRPVPRAQVFAVSETGPGGTADVRFLGMTSPQGVISLEPVRYSGDVVVVGADGAVAFVPDPQQSLPHIGARLAPKGRVLLAPALRPGPGDAPFVALQFELRYQGVPGIEVKSVRFASEATGWEFAGLAPGEYLVQVNGQSRQITVPEDGFVTLD